MHCNFFPIQYRFIKSSESIQTSSGCRPPAVPRRMPLGPRLQQLEAPRPRPHSRVRGWCAMETPLELRSGASDFGSRSLTHRSFGDCKLPAQPVSPWSLHSAPTVSTLLWGERGVQCQRFTPLRLTVGKRDHGYVYVHVRQKCTMQSQKQWHFHSLTMVTLFYN